MDEWRPGSMRGVKYPGQDGIKTGTTSQAGSVPVSNGRRGPDHLLMAVLGPESSLGRYVDSHNLCRRALAAAPASVIPRERFPAESPG